MAGKAPKKKGGGSNPSPPSPPNSNPGFGSRLNNFFKRVRTSKHGKKIVEKVKKSTSVAKGTVAGTTRRLADKVSAEVHTGINELKQNTAKY